MNKICQPSPPIRKRRAMKRPTEQGTARIEEKLDGLVTLLKSATQGASGLGVFNAAHVQEAQLNSAQSNRDSSQGSRSSHSPAYTQRGSQHTTQVSQRIGFTSVDSSCSELLEERIRPSNQPLARLALRLSEKQAETYFNKFRSDFIPQLPFVVIPPSLTSSKLYEKSPILWLSIMAVTASERPQQLELANEIRNIIAREAYIKGARSMDLLNAALVYAAW